MMMKEVYKRETCRVCTKRLLKKVLTLGPTPLANEFLSAREIDKGEKFYPLDLYYCSSCSFLQLGHVVSAQILFGNYVYVSSTSKVFIKHFEDFASHVSSQLSLGSKPFVIDLGSNDGILLKPFQKNGAEVLGIEPAVHIAKIAQKDGIATLPQYFSKKLARAVVRKYGKADVVAATNVFAHIDDLDEVIGGLQILLKDEGVFIMEAPYLIDFLRYRYFDLVYHEHLSYWSVDPLRTLFKRFNMSVFHVEKVPVHGGSIRVYVKKESSKRKTEKSVGRFLIEEKKMKLKNIKTYQEFALKIYENKIRLLELLAKLKADGKRIAAYGAPAKGNTLLNFFSIGQETLDFIVDDSPMKQGLYSPGKHLEVISSVEMYKRKPEYLLILAWNFSESIMQMHRRFTDAGGKFIIPVPKPRIV